MQLIWELRVEYGGVSGEVYGGITVVSHTAAASGKLCNHCGQIPRHLVETLPGRLLFCTQPIRSEGQSTIPFALTASYSKLQLSGEFRSSLGL